MTNKSTKYLARLLRADTDTIVHIDSQMSERFEKKSVLDALYEENKVRMGSLLKQLNVKRARALDIYNALINKVEQDDKALKSAFGISDGDGFGGYKRLAEKAKDLASVGEGFFLKWSKAEELLQKNPPPNIMSFFETDSVKALLEKEDIKKVFSSLRFAEDKDWLNNTFFTPYADLTPDDFERRPIEMLVLENKWIQLAEKFMKKKYHNVSHLKELGVIFVLPQDIKTNGESLRLFTLLLHYLHEVIFYSGLFYDSARGLHDSLWSAKKFSDFFVSALKGEVIDKRLPDGREINWMIVQRYLAKDDENDWRLFEAHVNPEALHWSRAEENISHIEEKMPGLDLSFWHDLDWIGDFFSTETGVEILVSFNLVDTVMSLVKKRELIKYLYHHQEALWNKIFMAYVGEDEMRNLINKNFSRGYITL